MYDCIYMYVYLYVWMMIRYDILNESMLEIIKYDDCRL